MCDESQPDYHLCLCGESLSYCVLRCSLCMVDWCCLRSQCPATGSVGAVHRWRGEPGYTVTPNRPAQPATGRDTQTYTTPTTRLSHGHGQYQTRSRSDRPQENDHGPVRLILSPNESRTTDLPGGKSFSSQCFLWSCHSLFCVHSEYQAENRMTISRYDNM